MIVARHPVAVLFGLVVGVFTLVFVALTYALLTGAEPGSQAGCNLGGAVDAAPLSTIGSREIPLPLVRLDREAAAAYGLGRDGWAWLAAVNRVETDFGRETATSPSGAIGWMQFEPSTWAEYGLDANRDGRADPYDPADAIAAAARYLRALGAPLDWPGAIRAYNGGPALAHAPATLSYWLRVAASATAYLGRSTTVAASVQPVCAPCPPADFTQAADAAVGPDPLGRGRPGGCAPGGAVPLAPGDRARIAASGLATPPASAPPAVRLMIAAANQLIGKPYVYGGGHQDFSLASGYDCSSSVSWALHGAGFLAGPEDSTTLEGFGLPGPGLWVTIFANPVHTFAYVAGIRLDTSPQPGDGSLGQPGPRWRPATRSVGGFILRHPPGL